MRACRSMPRRCSAPTTHSSRTDAELPNTTDVVRIGPLRLATFAGGRGFVTYAGFDGADAATIREWVGQVADHYRRNERIGAVEWKTRGHDLAPGLHQALTDNGFLPGEVESIMVGPAAGLADDVPVPDGVRLRRIDAEADI